LKIAITDSLTRTYNLGYFQECLDRAVEHYETTREPVSLLNLRKYFLLELFFCNKITGMVHIVFMG